MADVMEVKSIRISDMHEHVGREVQLKGWLYNSRASGKIQFLIIRDGTGLCQAVLEKNKDNGDLFSQIKRLGQESSLMVLGVVRQEPRSVGGYELMAGDVQVVHETEEYPITPKVS